LWIQCYLLSYVYTLYYILYYIYTPHDSYQYIRENLIIEYTHINLLLINSGEGDGIPVYDFGFFSPFFPCFKLQMLLI